MKTKHTALSLIATTCLLASSMSSAALILHVSEASWSIQPQVQNLETFDTTAANVALADEVSSAPGSNEQLNTGVLNYQASNTGFSADFRLSTLQNNSEFTYDDDENSGNIADFDDALSVGDINNFNDDSWELDILGSGGYAAISFFVNDSNDHAGETIDVYNISDSLIGSFVLDSVPLNQTAQFFGLISNNDLIGRVVYNESTDSDDIAISDFTFAGYDDPSFNSTTSVPVPGSTLLFAMGGLVAARRMRRRKH